MQSRMRFDEQGKLVGVDSKLGIFEVTDQNEEDSENISLKKTDSLDFLKKHGQEDISTDKDFWSLHQDGKSLNPIVFSDGRTQEDVVKDIVSSVKSGKKIILVHGACGTGKSAIALNVCRVLGRGTIVVPVKNLQRQYEEDYNNKKYLLKKDGKRLLMAILTGRENHDSIIKPGVPCSDTLLPDTIPLSDKHFGVIMEYYNQNPLIKNKMEIDSVSKLKRISIAPSNPYWSPILPAEVDLPLKDAKKKRYRGLSGKDFVFHHRKEGCSYYDQYQSYIDADVLLFNAAKYKIECSIDRKPYTEVDIIDEADEFLDSFSSQYTLNLSKLAGSLKMLFPDDESTQYAIDKILLSISLEEKRARALGINENQVFHIKDTDLEGILRLLRSSKGIEVEISLDDSSYVSKGLEAAEQFIDSLDETYLTYKLENGELSATFVTTNVSKKFLELANKCNSLVLMSGTLHSEKVLREVFNITDLAVINAEKSYNGNLEIHMTGKEIDCKYANFKSGKFTREDYLRALDSSLEAAKKPVLVHVNAFDDLPSETELSRLDLKNLISKEQLRIDQYKDKTGEIVKKFKNKETNVLFSTRCSRGVDFPGDICNSIVFTKYPNPDMSGTFWKILQKTHPQSFWDFYKDKAWREFLQRIYRALRSKNDHVYLLSPDKRVLEAARQFQNGK